MTVEEAYERTLAGQQARLADAARPIADLIRAELERGLRFVERIRVALHGAVKTSGNEPRGEAGAGTTADARHEAPTSPGCSKRCWKPTPCPDCGSPLPPRGRSVPLEMYTRDCCDRNAADRAINPRHLWSEDDDTRACSDPEWAAAQGLSR